MNRKNHDIEEYYKNVFERGYDPVNKVIRLHGDVDEDLWCFLDGALTDLEANKSKRRIIVRVNCFGGSVYSGRAIGDRLRSSSKFIVTEIYGKAMSAASLIAVSGDKVRMAKGAVFMHHEASLTFGADTTERFSTLSHEMAQFRKESDDWCHYMAERTEQPYEFWRDKGVGVDLTLSAVEALNLGVVNEIF